MAFFPEFFEGMIEKAVNRLTMPILARVIISHAPVKCQAVCSDIGEPFMDIKKGEVFEKEKIRFEIHDEVWLTCLCKRTKYGPINMFERALNMETQRDSQQVGP